MLQLHFTAQDLLQVRFAEGPAPLMELGLSAATLQRADRPEVFGRWRRDRQRTLPREALPLLQLVPANGAGPLFLDPLVDSLQEGLDGVMATGRDTARRELQRVCPAYRPVTPWVRDLADRDRAAWSQLHDAVRAAHDALIAPDWGRIRATYAADVAWRTSLLATHGLGAALTSLYPGSRWSGTTLQIDLPHAAELSLDGSGITLMPSTVWTGQPLVGDDGAGRRLLLYPALTPLPQAAADPAQDPVVALLGRTRAAVLRALSSPRTTGQLAHDLQISSASASQHVSTLRNAGLAASDRDGKNVWHVRTSLGSELLRG